MHCFKFRTLSATLGVMLAAQAYCAGARAADALLEKCIKLSSDAEEFYRNGQAEDMSDFKTLEAHGTALDEMRRLAREACAQSLQSPPASPDEKVVLARLTINGKSRKAAFALLHEAAAAGNGTAHAEIGNLYTRQSYVVQESPTDAVSWFRKAADLGDPLGQLRLGEMQFSGEGMPADQGAAVELFRKSAEQGFVDAQLKLGTAYQSGEGVEKDFAQAAVWFQKAASQNHAGAQNNLGNLYATGSGVDQDLDQAASLYRKAAAQGLAAGQHNLAVLLSEGRGVDRNPTEAAAWYQKAANQGYALAAYNLAIMYANGTGVPRNEEQAATFLLKAADAPDPLCIAHLNLAVYQFNARRFVDAAARAKRATFCKGAGKELIAKAEELAAKSRQANSSQGQLGFREALLGAAIIGLAVAATSSSTSSTGGASELSVEPNPFDGTCKAARMYGNSKLQNTATFWGCPW